MRKMFLLSLVFPVLVSAQIRDDFSDGDFTNDPSWEGDVAHFQVSSSTAIPESQRPALQLNAPAAGESFLSVNVQLDGELEWHSWIKMSLNSSSGNFARIYLFSDTSVFTSPAYGYFIQIGGLEDSVMFCRQDGGNIVRLLRLSTAYTGNSTNSLRFRITRSQEGAWEFYADPGGGSQLEFQGAVTDPVYPAGRFFGIYCQYTTSNVNKFYFDDFYAGPLIIDSLPPQLVKAQAVNAGEIMLLFDEAVDQGIAENVLNYEVNGNIGSPYAAIRILDAQQIRLFFDHQFQNGVTYRVSIMNMKDLAGNASGPQTGEFLYYHPRPYDVVFSEIMADPSPPAGLPEVEYLELFNRGLFEIDLTGWALSITSTKHSLPGITMQPGEYLLIAGQNDVEALQTFGPVIGLSSFTLPNNGASLHLTDPEGQTICSLKYDISWYKNETKSVGGWSLEMIHSGNPCLGEINWMASGHPSGGTPGRENSFQALPDDGLYIENICLTDLGTVEVTFSQSLDSLPATESWRYNISPDPGNPERITTNPPDFRSIVLQYGASFTAGQIYELIITNGMMNCIGEELTVSQPALFALAEPSVEFDVVLNEILFNPLGDGVDYVEVYNRSGKTIDLSELILASVKETPPNPPDTQKTRVSESCRTLLPGQYLVLTSDPEKVKNQYYTRDPRAFWKMKSFPSYNNDQGFALLLNSGNVLIDGMRYQEDMHYSLLNSYDGVSLEKISTERLGDHADNWHSAAETVGFGTPGYQNSQFIEAWDDKGSSLSLHPEVFSPDSDGIDDQLGITCQFDDPGKLVTILVFNAAGNLVRTLVNNELTGTSSVFSWDGTYDDRTPGSNGIYIVYLEALGMDGKTRRFKKACVLARRR